MTEITGLTAERMLQIEAASVIGGEVVGDDLILEKRSGSTFNAGHVRGRQGLSLAPMFVYFGESNSGGQSPNSALTAAEKLVRPKVQIFNPNTSAFESLHIGVNNNLGHTGLDSTTHGWEAGQANDVESGKFVDDRIFVVKCGHGGSTLAQWEAGGAYWNAFLTRVRAAKALLKADKLFPSVYCLYSHGINDFLSTSPSVFKARVVELHERVRAELGYVPIFATKLMPAYDTFNTMLSQIAGAQPATKLIETAGLPLDDANHWSSAGMKTIASRMDDAALAWGEVGSYAQGQATAAAKLASLSTSRPGGHLLQSNAVWSDLTRAVDAGSGALRRSASGFPAGGSTTKVIDASKEFWFEWVVTATNNTVVVFISSATESVNYNASRSFISASFWTAGTIYTGAVDLIGNPSGPVSPGDIIRAVKAGTNLNYYRSIDGGGSWIFLYTHAGVLPTSGTLKVRALYSTDLANQTVAVRLGTET